MTQPFVPINDASEAAPVEGVTAPAPDGVAAVEGATVIPARLDQDHSTPKAADDDAGDDGDTAAGLDRLNPDAGSADEGDASSPELPQAGSDGTTATIGMPTGDATADGSASDSEAGEAPSTGFLPGE